MADTQAAQIISEAEKRAHATYTSAENRAQKVLAAAEDRMNQLKVERGAVARYFESLGDVIANAQRLTSHSEQKTAADVAAAEIDAARINGSPAETATVDSEVTAAIDPAALNAKAAEQG